MKFLLDVNALIAWSQQRSPHHARFHAWAVAHGFGQLAMCAHAELGFIRVSMQAFGDSLAEAQLQLATMKRQSGGFVGSAPSPKLAAWSTTAARTSDAYLAQVASSAGIKLATFDAGIPGGVLM